VIESDLIAIMGREQSPHRGWRRRLPISRAPSGRLRPYTGVASLRRRSPLVTI